MAHSFEASFNLGDAIAKAESQKRGELAQDLGERLILCDKHGEYTSIGKLYLGRREIWSRCKECDDEYRAEELRKEEERKAQELQDRMGMLLREACIPKRFEGRTFGNFNAQTDKQKSALAIASAYAAEFDDHRKKGTGLIMSGLPGTGKSHLSAAILQGIMPKHLGLYTTCMNIIRNVRGTWRRDSESSEAEILEGYEKAALLVIDEVGVQYGTDGEQTILFDVLDRRYRNMKPTILLTNQAKQGFKDFIGERSYDRLTETSRWVSFDWPSYRPQAKKELA